MQLLSLILAKKEMRNHFNLLLVMLAVYDACYLLGEILEKSIQYDYHHFVVLLEMASLSE